MKVKVIIAAALATLWSSLALAQSNPGLSYGQVPTAAQWNSYFAGKQDYLGAVPCTAAGCTLTGKLTTAASSTSGAGLNLPPGTAPTGPINGDLWTTTLGLYARVNGSTIGPFTSGSTPAFSAPLVVNLNSAAAPAAQVGTGIQLVQADGVVARAELDGFGTGNTTAVPRWTCVRRDGTNASPSALVLGDEICSFNSFGYDGTSVIGPVGALRIYANQNWSVGANGTYLRLGVTPNGSATMADAVSVENDGGLTLGSLVGSANSKGAGTINLPGGVYVSGQPVTPATAGVAGTLLAGQGTSTKPIYTATPTLGASGTLGTLALGNATSGTVTIQPATGALGSSVATLPANTGTIAELNLAQSWSGLQTFSNGVTISGSFTATGLVGNGALVNASTTVNGQTCTLGSTCTITASAGSITAGTTTVTGGPGALYNTSSGGTLVAGLLPLTDLATQAANTALVNATSGAASPTAQAVASCSTAASALNWTTNVGFGCNTSITASVAPAGGLTGTTLASGVVTSSLTSVGTLTSGSIGAGFTAIPNSALANAATTVNGQTCTLGSTCTITASAGSITAGTTTVTGGPGVLSNSSSGGTLVSSLALPASVTASNATLSGTSTSITNVGTFALRDTSAAFDVTLAATSSTTLTAGRTLTLDTGNVTHTLKFGTTANTITFPNLASFTVLTNGDTGSVTSTILANSLSLVTPNINVATGTSLALNGCTIGTNALCTTGTAAISSTLTSAAHTVTSASASSLAAGLNGATNPAFSVDTSTALQVAGLNVKGAVTGGTVAIAAIDSGANTNLTINAKGTGTIGIGSVSTGAVTITPATTITGALTLTGGLNTPLTGTYGGTGVNNGANTITVGGNLSSTSTVSITGALSTAAALTHAGAFATTITATATTNSTLPAGTHTLAGLDVAQTWSATQTFSNAVVLSAGLSAPLALTSGGTNASLTASLGGVVYSTATAFAVLSGTGTAGQCLLSGATAAPTWGSCLGGAAVSSVSNADSTLTVSPTTGAVVASLNLGNANTWTGVQTHNNSTIKMLGSSTGATTITSANAGTSNFTLTLPAVTDTVATLGTASQVMSGGVILTANNIGTVSSGTTTINCGSNPIQYLTNNGAFTLAAPANDSSCLVMITNGASAGAITFSGFTVGASTGDTLTTTNTQKFTLSIWRINGTASYRIAAMQ